MMLITIERPTATGQNITAVLGGQQKTPPLLMVWGFVLKALTQKARGSSQLLAVIIPPDIELAFEMTIKRFLVLLEALENRGGFGKNRVNRNFGFQ